jgi:hypothetical protein
MQKISLTGKWQFSIDKSFDDEILLPGTMDENKKGENNDERLTNHLTRLYKYTGPAWYRRQIEILPEWAGKRIAFTMERTKNSRVWIDDTTLGERNSLSCRHEYLFPSDITAGSHTLTVCIDNGKMPPLGNSHQVSEDTQTNWNGILGEINLQITDPVWISQLRLFPDAAHKKVKVVAEIKTVALGIPAQGMLKISTGATLPVNVEFALSDVCKIEHEYPLGDDAVLWNEFNTTVYTLNVEMSASSANGEYSDSASSTFGLVDFAANGTQFAVNGKTTFLRGKHDACVFPLTGYAPMDVDGWVRVMSIAKDYGINHYRFHSWCPPAAAFEAADRVGIYLQPELPNWMPFRHPRSAGPDAGLHMAYLLAEGERILTEFGNHPSFVMFALGNEFCEGRELMQEIIAHFRTVHPQLLFAQASNTYYPAPTLPAGDDYWTTMRTEKESTRGSFSHADLPLGSVQTGPPTTDNDFSAAIVGVPVPVIGHETGQYQVYPNYDEIEKYTGISRAYNFEIFRERLIASGMGDLSDDFFRASGALAALCYREEIEMAIRTDGFAGFQLLDLQDFPGQGTALVGILDAFMQSKGIISPEAWRQFCCEIVPLVRMEKYCWLDGEIFNAKLQVAHFGNAFLSNAVARWEIFINDERIAGEEVSLTIASNGLYDAGEINSPVKIDKPAKVKVVFSIDGTPYRNSYNVWFYPFETRKKSPDIIQCSKLGDAEIEKLVAGGNILLMPDKGKAKVIGGSFASDFWCWRMFKNITDYKELPEAPGTLGMLCDPTHPIFADFPTDFHSDWQWFGVHTASRPIILDSTPADYRPIAQIIDNVDRNHKLGLIFEAKVGKGKLLVCACNLFFCYDNAANQLLKSIFKYMDSEDFNPQEELTVEHLRGIFKG